jgi:hypothetical protein
MWILLLYDEAPDDDELGVRGPAGRAGPAGGARDGCRRSADVWNSSRLIAEEVCGSPLKCTVRVVRWAEAWPMLQAILASHPSPFGGAVTAATGPASMASHLPRRRREERAREETEHEAFLSLCGLSPCAARRIATHFAFRDFIGLTAPLRLAHFGWVPEPALCLLSYVKIAMYIVSRRLLLRTTGTFPIGARVRTPPPVLRR